jgi:hypothetical protein
VAGAGGNNPPPGGNGNPGPTSAVGSYNGLFYPDAALTVGNSGALSLKVASNSKYTGTMSVGGKRYKLAGTLDNDGAASQSISRGSAAPPLNVAFRIDPFAPGRITGIVSDGSFTANLIGQRAADKTTSAPAQVGAYTLVLPGGDAAAGQPAGDSWMTVTVDRSGRVRMAGAMADGSKVSQSGMLAINGDMPVYIPLHGGKGALVGWLSFSDTDVTGDLIWTKPTTTSGLYPAGFTFTTTAIGSVFTRPDSGTPILTGSQVSLSGGDLTTEIYEPIQISSKGQVTDLGSSKLKVTLSSANGSFKGSIANPATGKPLSFSGVVLTSQNVGRGFFLGPQNSGKVVIQ